MGQIHTSVALQIGSYKLKKRTDRDNLAYFTCNGCDKLGWYLKATARKLSNGEYELIKWPGDEHICSQNL